MGKQTVDVNALMSPLLKKYNVNVELLNSEKHRKDEVLKLRDVFNEKDGFNANNLMNWCKLNNIKLSAITIAKWMDKENTTVSPTSTKRHKAPVSASVAPASFLNALTSGSADNPAMVLLGEYLRVLPPEAVKVVINTVEQILTPQQKLDAQKTAKEMMLSDYMEMVRIHAQTNIDNMFSTISTPVEVASVEDKKDEGKPGDLVPKAEPETADGTETESDFLDRMKQVICNNQPLENIDYQRLLALKAKGNKRALKLMDVFETSPEIEEATPEATETSAA